MYNKILLKIPQEFLTKFYYNMMYFEKKNNQLVD